MEEVTVKNYQELAMRTCLPSAKNWKYCYCLIASEIGEAFGKWGKKFRDGEFNKEKLTDELGDVFWGIALACELGGYEFESLWKYNYNRKCFYADVYFPIPYQFNELNWIIFDGLASKFLAWARIFAEQCGIDPLDCLRRNIAKLAGRQERGTLAGNGDER